MSVNAPTETLEPVKYAGSPYLDEVNDLKEELFQAERQDREPNLDNFHPSAIEAVNPSLLTKKQAKELAKPRGDVEQPDPAGLSYIEANGDEDWRIEAGQDTLIVPDEVDPTEKNEDVNESSEDEDVNEDEIVNELDETEKELVDAGIIESKDAEPVKTKSAKAKDNK